ncbi:uncharacterized protein [Magallana gigas]|uniref:uncharacterized protein isoform X3 n=1 Tax=Magallana gigas TaxID=29159 RepID=UPI003341763B
MNLKYWCITVLVLQLAMGKMQTEELYDRSSEKNIMEGLEIISTYFKEFNESLIGYVSQPSTWKQEFKGSCRNSTVKSFFQEISRISDLRVIVRNTTKQLSLCFSEELDQPVPEEVNEICLHKQSTKNRLKNSNARTYFGEDEGGDSISCSIKVKHGVISTQSTNINTVITSTQSANEFNISTKAINILESERKLRAILVLQTMMSEIKTQKFYNSSNEKIIMEGLEIIGTYFKEFNNTLADYVSQESQNFQASRKHELKANCRNATVKTSFQEISRKSNLKVIVRNTTEQLSLCFSEEMDQPVPEEVNEICLHKQSIKKSLKNSKAGKFFGENGGGDSISCSVDVKHRLVSMQSVNNTITHTKILESERKLRVTFCNLEILLENILRK